MGVTRERFGQGMTYSEFKDVMTMNREQFEANERGLQLSAEELKPFVDLPNPVDVLVIAGDWCADVIANFPLLGRIAADTGQLNLRVFDRDQNMDIMNQYLNQGLYQSIPVFVFYDEDFNELGVWIERPAAVTELREQRRRELHAQNPEFGAPEASPNEIADETRQRLRQAIGQMRNDTKAFADHEVVRELGEIVKRVAERATTPAR